MSITYCVEREKEFIRINVTGYLTDRDVATVLRAILADPEVRPGMNVLADLRSIQDSSISRAGVEEALLVLGEFGQLDSVHKMALVANGYETGAAIELLQLLLKRFPADLRLCPDLVDAETWLHQPTGI